MSNKESLIALEELKLQIAELEEVVSKLSSLEIMLGSVFQVLQYKETPITARNKGKIIGEVINNVNRLNNRLSNIRQRLENHVNKAINLLEVQDI